MRTTNIINFNLYKACKQDVPNGCSEYENQAIEYTPDHENRNSLSKTASAPFCISINIQDQSSNSNHYTSLKEVSQLETVRKNDVKKDMQIQNQETEDLKRKPRLVPEPEHSRVKKSFSIDSRPTINKEFDVISPVSSGFKASQLCYTQKSSAMESVKNTPNTSFSVETKDMAQQLLQAKSEIHKLRLELQKERNMREMQICKLCCSKAIVGIDGEFVGEYLSKQIQKIKDEYESDLLFQKLEHEAEIEAANGPKKGSPAGSTNCSTIKAPSLMFAGNVSINMSNYSSTKHLISLPAVPEESKEMNGDDDKVRLPIASHMQRASKGLIVGENTNDVKKIDNQINFDSMTKEELLALVRNQQSQIDSLSNKVELYEFKINEYECE